MDVDSRYTLKNHYVNKEQQKMKQPIMYFKDEEELRQATQKWKGILQLNDWLIKTKLVDEAIKEGNDTCDGINNVTYSTKTAIITISHCKDIDLAFKHCEELVLIHELLHCNIMAVENADRTIEQCIYEEVMHQPIDVIARALLMTEYNLTFEWFMEDVDNE